MVISSHKSNSFEILKLTFITLKFTFKIKLNFFPFSVLENIFLFFSDEVFDVYSPLSSITTSFDLFFIPLCAGLLLQYMYPRSTGFSKAILKRMAPFAVLCLYFTFLKSDLDLYVYGLFTWMVSHMTFLKVTFWKRSFLHFQKKSKELHANV